MSLNKNNISGLATIPEVLEELRQGRMVILMDDENRENEGDLLMASDFITPEAINFMVTHARGLVCLTLTPERCEQLGLQMMTQQNKSGFGTNFTVSIEAAEGVTTGISAADRARTIQVACAKDAKVGDVVTPGHIFPVRAVPGGVLIRAGHTEAGCDLTRMAGLTPAAAICEILKPDGTMARMPDLLEFAKEHHIKIATIADLIQYRSQHESMVMRVGQKELQTPWGCFQAIAYQDKVSNASHIALVHGTIKSEEETLVRVHEPANLLDLLDTTDATHSWGVAKALNVISSREQPGVMILLNCDGDPLQVQARLSHWGQPPEPKQPINVDKYDLKTYGIGAQILCDLNVGLMRVLAHPRKMPSMVGYGLTVCGYLEETTN